MRFGIPGRAVYVRRGLVYQFVPHVIGLSKSRFTSGLLCHLRLWWTVHEPDAPELVTADGQPAIFDQGDRVGELARTYVPGGYLVDLPRYAVQDRVDATRTAIAGGASVVYEASFLEDDVFVAVDILKKERRGWTFLEVKSSTRAKPHHLPDAAIQAHVLRRAGLDVTRVEIMHLNPECRHPDLTNLFVRTDVTEEVEAMLPAMPHLIIGQLWMLRGDQPPAAATGDHCTTPYHCPFMDRCWTSAPEHGVGTLYRIGKKKRAALAAGGHETINEIPSDFPLSKVAARQRAAVVSGEIVVEPGLAEALAELTSPIAHLDFETIGPAIPAWPGCRPYEAVPVQFSCHIEDGVTPPRHVEWLADGPEDPRPAIAGALVEALRGARTIIAYNASFEAQRLEGLAEAAPEIADELREIAGRLRDLLPIVRDHVYHPAFGGFGLKSVAPVLVPEIGYDGLEISDGITASRQLEALLLRGESVSVVERNRIRTALLAYCATDTLATMGLLKRLRELA